MSDDELRYQKKLVVYGMCSICYAMFTKDGLKEKRMEAGMSYGCPVCRSYDKLEDYEGVLSWKKI
jgi:hypothetical protein